MPAQQISNTFTIEVAGRPLPADLELHGVVVDDSLHLPDRFVFVVRDPERTAVEKAGLRIGAAVKISVVSDATPGPQPLVTGEITGIEADVRPTGSFTIVRGYDESHRLVRGRLTRSYANASYADCARDVARRLGLGAGTIDATQPVHDHISQGNVSDWEFLNGLAARVGYEVAVSDRKLHFRRPVPARESSGSSADYDREQPLDLLVGSGLLRLRAVASAAEQTKEVEVRGWDPANKRALTAREAVRTEGYRAGVSSAEVAGQFPSPAYVVANAGLVQQGEVDAGARAAAEKVAGALVELEAAARGNPRLKAGCTVRVGLAGPPFDGSYVVTSSRHSYDPDEGYVTEVTVSGREDRAGLALGGASAAAGAPRPQQGVVPALVTDVDDPLGQARVKVRFPWLSDDYVSDWARLAAPGAADRRGLLALPEVGDEVLVAFEHGDVRRPYVLGGLWNGKDAPCLPKGDLVDGTSHAVTRRAFVSRTGHRVVLSDDDRASYVEIASGDGSIVVKLDQSGSELAISCGGTITIDARADLKVTAGGTFDVQARTVKLTGQASAELSAASVEINATGQTKVTGNPIMLN